jgi:cytochrome o ubiquinol oxidase subunit 3
MEESLTLTKHPGHEEEIYSNTIFGFWVYLMTDCILFVTLFTTYGVLHRNTFGGPSAAELLSVPSSLAETSLLLLSSLSCGLGMLAAIRQDKKRLIAWFSVAFLMGLSFVILELKEFNHLVQEGHSWQKSAFLSSFFTLVGTHGLHVSFGLLWMVVLMAQIILKGLTVDTFRRLVCFNMFWHFLDLVWIFIFTFVYLMGAV